jgi:hypothetical protein
VRERRKKEVRREKKGGIRRGRGCLRIDDRVCIDLEEGIGALESAMELGF